MRWVGVEIIRINDVLSSAGLAYWTGTELGNKDLSKLSSTVCFYFCLLSSCVSVFILKGNYCVLSFQTIIKLAN